MDRQGADAPPLVVRAKQYLCTEGRKTEMEKYIDITKPVKVEKQTIDVNQVYTAIVEEVAKNRHHYSEYDVLCFISGYAPNMPISVAVRIVWEMRRREIL